MRGLMFATLLCCSVAVSADTGRPMPGSYRGASVEDFKVIDAANFAVDKMCKGKLVNIVSAHQQVVAGMNYDLVLQLKTPKGKIRTVEVTVFVPLPATGKPMVLKSVEELDD